MLGIVMFYLLPPAFCLLPPAIFSDGGHAKEQKTRLLKRNGLKSLYSGSHLSEVHGSCN